MGTLARAAALGEASRGRDQGPRQDRGLSIADPDQGRGHVEGHSRRHRRHRLVRARLLARADAVVGRHVAAVPADQLSREGKRSALEALREIPSVQKEYSEIEPLLLYTSSPNLLVSKRQVKTLDEFKGLKFRVLGGPPTEMAKALGAVPTLIPMPDVYQSLDKGVVDGAAAPWEAVQAFRLYEVAKNFTIAPFYVAYFSLCANKQKWQSLPQDVRGAIMSVS